ncbi:MAG TPA: ATP-binding protein, partial [Granulicella sp.]
HSGSVCVESTVGKGSTFTVTLPLGRSHLRESEIGAARTQTSTALGAAPFVQEALRWLPESSSEEEGVLRDLEPVPPADEWERARVVLADDNADMRDYVRRLLAIRHEVEAVADGEAALAAVARERPDLMLSDIMMPRLDGMQLLARLRADPHTSTIPVILLSARAGEESRVEGMRAGADDYLIKPFSARELLARVEAHLKMSRYRREFTEALRASEERYRAFVTASADVVYRMSPDWREMRFLRGKDFIPDTEDPSRGWLTKYIHPDDQARVLAAINEAMQTKHIFQMEHRVIRLDGTLGWAHSRAIPLLDAHGEIIEWFGAAHDVSGRKEAEKALRESEERFRMMADNISQLAWTCDQLGIVTWYNRRWLEYTGMTLEQMAGWGWKRVQHPEHVDRVVAGVMRSQQTGEPWEDTFPLRGEDGCYRWFLSRAIPIRDDTGKVIRWFGTNTDITEQREAEQALRIADQRKDEYVAMLAHELRNPLAPISNGAALLRMKAEVDPSLQAVAAMIDRQVRHMARLLEDPLDVGRISQHKITLQRTPVAIATVVSRALETSRPLIAARHHRLNAPAPAKGLYVLGDLTRLTQALANVLNNAAKYTPEGGSIWVSTPAAGGFVEIVVSDDGVGIAAEMLPLVFDLFVQAKRDADRSEGGLGIGLALVRKIIDLHGGTVHASSEGMGRGAQVTLRLPLHVPADERLPESAEVARPARPPRTGRRVLIVEDNIDTTTVPTLNAACAVSRRM